MMPVMVASVDAGGKSVEEVTKLVNDTVLPAMQRVDRWVPSPPPA